MCVLCEYRGKREGAKRMVQSKELEPMPCCFPLVAFFYIGFGVSRDLVFVVFVVACILSNTLDEDRCDL